MEMSNTETGFIFFNRTYRDMMNPTVEQADATTQFDVETLELTIPANPVTKQAEVAIASEVVAKYLPYTAQAKLSKNYRPTEMMHYHLACK